MVMKTRVTTCVVAASAMATVSLAGGTPLQPTAGAPLDGLTAEQLDDGDARDLLG